LGGPLAPVSYAQAVTARPADPEITANLAETLKVEATSLATPMIVDVALARRNDRGWPVHIVAARLVGPEFTGGEVATWAIGGPTSYGPIFALNETARTYTPWGEAAQPGS